MITPRFKLWQDENSVSINIHAPYCSLKDLDVVVEDSIFVFVCKPYYLRLNLPGNIVENEQSKSSFDSDLCEFTFTCQKQINGEHFQDLELITQLLVKKVDASYNNESPKIELLANEDVAEKDFNTDNLEYGFGFALRARKGFVRISSEFSEVFEIDPCEIPLKERHKMRIQFEQGKFNSEHYIADFTDDSTINEIIELKSPWVDASKLHFTDKELDFLKDLPNRQYCLTEKQVNYCHNGLLDILFAYCYDQRTTFYDSSEESGWTIIKLASTLSWLDALDCPKDTLTAAFRRSVIYPLYRHFKLSEKVLEDVKCILELGELCITKALIHMYNIFLKGDNSRYIVNDLFIKDYIIYIMNWDQILWKSIVDKTLLITVKKENLGLNLSQLEDLNLELLTHLKLDDSSCSDETSSDEDSSEDSNSVTSDDSDSSTDTQSSNN